MVLGNGMRASRFMRGCWFSSSHQVETRVLHLLQAVPWLRISGRGFPHSEQNMVATPVVESRTLRLFAVDDYIFFIKPTAYTYQYVARLLSYEGKAGASS
jgi:hypothetical protein